MKFVIEFFKDLKFIVISDGIFSAVFLFVCMIPVFVFSLIFLPFEIFNDWSKTWFKEN